MQPDRYTKIVLTVIAAALLGLVVQNAIPGATAQNRTIQRVTICDEDGVQCAGIVRSIFGPNAGHAGMAVAVVN